MTAKLYRMTWIRPLGRHIPVDAETMEAYHRDLNRWAERREGWKKLGVWLAMCAFCALCWYGIIWLAYKATEGR